MNKPYVKLQPSEVALLGSASTIYAGRLAAGAIAEGGESEAMQKAVGEAIQIAKLIDASVMADEEFD